MWKLLFALALPLAPSAAADITAHDRPIPAQAAAEAQCHIRVEEAADGVELEGVVVSGSPLSGTYRFDVSKTGSAGTSTTHQSGTLEAEAGEDVIGTVRLSLEPDATYEVELVVEWNGGETTCTASGPDRA